MMASGGDLGASVVPQIVGIVTDSISATEFAQSLAVTLGTSADTVGMKAGMLVAAIFPIIAIFVYAYLLKTKRKGIKQNEDKHS